MNSADLSSTELTALMLEMAKSLGAELAGIATVDSLAGGPPSADLAYVLPGARSAVCFAIPLDQEKIGPYLRKEDHAGHNLDKIRATTLAGGIALEMATFLGQLGYPAVPLAANFQYRNDGQVTYADRKPPVSHRYLAVRSGIGHFGMSGNVITRRFGAAIALGSLVTRAELAPTGPLPDSDNYCDKCGLCRAACPSGLFAKDEPAEVTLGGHRFSYAARQPYVRCNYVCGGYAGLDRSGKWSTWSPSRYPIPEKDEDFPGAFAAAAGPYTKRPIPGHAYYNSVKPGFKTEYTCSHCQLICHPDKKVRVERYRMVINGGVIVQKSDGSREALAPDEARKRLAAMGPDRRRTYELQ